MRRERPGDRPQAAATVAVQTRREEFADRVVGLLQLLSSMSSLSGISDDVVEALTGAAAQRPTTADNGDDDDDANARENFAHYRSQRALGGDTSERLRPLEGRADDAVGKRRKTVTVRFGHAKLSYKRIAET
jgi:hypothetical protein